MRVAVTAQGARLGGLVDPRFGRAKFFVVVDTATGESTTLQGGNVKSYTGATGSVSDAVGQLEAGWLECVSKRNVEGHWV